MTSLLCLCFLSLICGINSLTTQHKNYHISTILIPNTNYKHSKICAQNKLAIKSVSFYNIHESNIRIDLNIIEPHVMIQYINYYQYTLQETIHILPTELDNTTFHIHIKDDETRICSPTYVILPITNNDMKLKCALSQWNAETNTIIYECHAVHILLSAPSTTIFYAMDKEYKSALARYNEHKRRLFTDINATSKPSMYTTQERDYLLLNHSKHPTIAFNWILIGVLTIFIPLSCCVFGVCCIKKKKEKNTNKLPSNQTNREITDGNDTDDTFIPILCSSPDHQITNRSKSASSLLDDEIASVQMTNIAHESSSSTNDGKTNTLLQNGESTNSERIRLKRRLDTDSFDTNTSCTTDEEYEGDGYDVDHVRVTLDPIKYMKVLPDDDEDRCDLYELEIRRDSGDIDHNKLESNSWGTSLPLHEGGLFGSKEELNQYTFFYQPQIKKKRRKKDKFKVRIKEDIIHVQEIENDVINQMITDSEMSEC